MRGKNKCKILKEIRQKIADENDIPYVTQECSFQGECSGTCPKCEAELRYLEQQLEKRKKLGKTVTVAALSASLMAGLTACPIVETVIEEVPPTQQASTSEERSSGWENLVLGQMETVSTTQEDLILPGMIAPPEWRETEYPTEDTVELEGDIAYIEPTEDDAEFLGAPTLPND